MSAVENLSLGFEPTIYKSSSLFSSSRSRCGHRFVRYEVCITCKSTVDKRQGRAFDYLVQGFQLSHEAVALMKRITTQLYCLNKKKFHFVFDLDPTLLLSIKVSCLSETDKYLIKVTDSTSKKNLWRLNNEFLTKLRAYDHLFVSS